MLKSEVENTTYSEFLKISHNILCLPIDKTPSMYYTICTSKIKI